MRAKFKVFVNGKTYEMENDGESLFEIFNVKNLTNQIILDAYREALEGAKNKSDAVLSVAVALDVSERTVYRVIDKHCND